MQKNVDSEKTDEASVLLIQPFNLKIYFHNFKLKYTFLYLIISEHLSNAMWIYSVFHSQIKTSCFEVAYHHHLTSGVVFKNNKKELLVN